MVGELVSKHVFFFGGCIMFTCPNKIGARWDVLFVLQSISGAKLIDEMIFKFCFGSLPLGCFWIMISQKKSDSLVNGQYFIERIFSPVAHVWPRRIKLRW